jgi:EpsI family protein
VSPILKPAGDLTRRAILIGSAQVATAVAAYAATPRRAEGRLAKFRLEDLISLKVGSWGFVSRAGVVVPRSDGPVDGYDQVVTRVYEAPNLPAIMLLLAYGSTQGGSLQLHRPETCYPGQGFTLSDSAPRDLDFGTNEIIQARAFTARRDQRIERLIYWTRIANSFPRNTAEEYEAIFGSVLKGVTPDGILVRVSTLGTDVDLMDKALEVFVAALMDTTPDAGLQILVGPVMAAAVSRRVVL